MKDKDGQWGMNKKIKKKFFIAGMYETEAIEKFLEEQAAKGWMFVRGSGMFYVFEECEPVSIKFQVDYFDKATIIDSFPASKTLDYIEYCRESGWKHIFSSGKMQIFCSYEEDPTPIQTDDSLKLKLMSKATLLTNGLTWIILPAMWGFTIWHDMINDLLEPRYYSTYSSYLTGFSGLGIVIFWTAFLLYGIINMIRFGIFFGKNRKRIKSGLGIKYFSYRSVKRFGRFSAIYLLALLLILVSFYVKDTFSLIFFMIMCVLLTGMVFIINKVMYFKGANRSTNMIFSILIPIVSINVIIIIVVAGMILSQNSVMRHKNSMYFYETDKIDITLEDLKVDKPEDFLYEETRHEKASTFLAKREVYSDSFYETEGSMGYSIEIFSSRYDTIMEKYKSLVTEDDNFPVSRIEDSLDEWNSETVYSGHNLRNVKMYAVIENDRVFVISGELDNEQAAKLASFYVDKFKDK